MGIDWYVAFLSLSGVYMLNSLSVHTRLWGWIFNVIATIGYLIIYYQTVQWGLFVASFGWLAAEIRGIYICLKGLDKLK